MDNNATCHCYRSTCSPRVGYDSIASYRIIVLHVTASGRNYSLKHQIDQVIRFVQERPFLFDVSSAELA